MGDFCIYWKQRHFHPHQNNLINPKLPQKDFSQQKIEAPSFSPQKKDVTSTQD